MHPRDSFEVWLTHWSSAGQTYEAVFSQEVPLDNHSDIVDRLLQAYRTATKDDPDRSFAKSDIWSHLKSNWHGDILKLLKANDVGGLTNYLANAHGQGITHGITQGSKATNELRARSDARLSEACRFADYLVSLAEYLGILQLESPEQLGRWGENLYEPPDRLISAVSRQIGIPVVPPQVIGSLFGIQTDDGILCGRDLLSLYAGLRLVSLLKQLKATSSSVCEIGAGLGGAAYYAHKLGIRRYTVIDLPLINVLQGYYLLRALPDARICLYGEQLTADCDIALLPAWMLGREPQKDAVLFNQDSFPEMNRAYAHGYLNAARNAVSHGILSINQEAKALQNRTEHQPTMQELVESVGGYERVSRHRHWLRPDYVEEYYAIVP